MLSHVKFVCRILCLVIFSGLINATANAATPPSEASTITRTKNAQVLKQLPFSEQEDFQEIAKGFIGKPEQLIIKNKQGKVIWDMEQYKQFEGLNSAAPDTVNPSLWRQARLNTSYGLFQVTDNIYQVRGYDLSVMSIIKSNNGYIVVDPLISVGTAKAALELVYEHLGKKPVVAVIYTHSHIDHFGGVRGVVSGDDVKSGKVKIFAPKDFMTNAIAENVMAGNAMSRRSMYMYGALLPRNAQGLVDSGLGKTTSTGVPTLIPPTDIINFNNTEHTIDGIKFVFQYTPNTEAPSEMNFYLPQFKALCIAENAVHTMHNLYTLRGAEVRDAKSWVDYLNETLASFGDDMEVVFASHHWPTWGNAAGKTFLQNQRDMYKYIHDQTLHLANQGYTMLEIAEQIQLPSSLADQWYNRGYYGSLKHNAKAVYQKYLGWFDANPANLDPLPPVTASQEYVTYMGGADAILQKAEQDYAQGKYRWVAQVLNHVVFAEPNNQAAKKLLAKTYDQLGYQAENATWRNFYLTAAMELRDGVDRNIALETYSPDIIVAMSIDLLFDYLGVRLDGPKADGKHIIINWQFPDLNEQYKMELVNSVLLYFPDQQAEQADATIIINRSTLNEIIMSQLDVEQGIKAGNITVQGNVAKAKELFSLFDNFDFMFNIVTP